MYVQIPQESFLDLCLCIATALVSRSMLANTGQTIPDEKTAWGLSYLHRLRHWANQLWIFLPMTSAAGVRFLERKSVGEEKYNKVAAQEAPTINTDHVKHCASLGVTLTLTSSQRW